MAKAKLHTGEILEFDDDLSDSEIDAAVAAYLAKQKVWQALAVEIRGVRDAVIKTNTALLEVAQAPRVTSIVQDANGKPSQSVTTISPSIFKEPTNG